MVIKTGIVTGVNEKNSHVPCTVIPIESNLPPNPVRRLVFSQDSFEQECVKVFSSSKKPKAKTSAGNTLNSLNSLKAYSVEALTNTPDESTVDFLTSLDGCNNLLGAVKLAANKRYPFTFTPECLWYTIIEGASLHMENELVRSGVPFLENNGSKTTANRNEIQTQTKDKQDKLDWEEIVNNIGDFYKHKYQSYTSRLHTEDTGVSFDDDSAARIKHNPIYTTNGSTTASATSMRLCRKVPQSSNEGSMTYKRYVVGVHDHIPEIHIKGTAENYQELIRKVEEMAQDLQLQWWAIELIPVLEQFLLTIQGNVDEHFWRYMINLNNKNGLYMPYSGWIQVFYPYVDDGFGNLVLNDFIGEARSGYNQVMPSKVAKYPKKKFPSSFCATNVQVQFGTHNEPAKTPAVPDTNPQENIPLIKNYVLRTGLIGILQNKANRAIQPAFGFLVVENEKSTSSPQEQSQTDPEVTEPVLIPVKKYKK